MAAVQDAGRSDNFNALGCCPSLSSVKTMRPYSVLLLTWLTAGGGAVLGSILGNAAGRVGLMLGALVGGIAGVVAGVVAAGRFRWLDPAERRGGLWGGIVGFLLAAPLAATNLDNPITPVLSCGLVGIGVLIGAGVTRGT